VDQNDDWVKLFIHTFLSAWTEVQYHQLYMSMNSCHTSCTTSGISSYETCTSICVAVRCSWNCGTPTCFICGQHQW